MHWGCIKSAVILLFAVVLMSLCAEVVVQNIQPVLISLNLPHVSSKCWKLTYSYMQLVSLASLKNIKAFP